MSNNFFMRIIVCLLLCFTVTTLFAETNALYHFADASKAERFNALTHEVRCVVCQNQTIADSYAPIANDLRNKIYQLLNQNKSDADIKNYLVKRYGEFILLRPRFIFANLFLWVFPILIFSIAILFLVRAIRTKYQINQV